MSPILLLLGLGVVALACSKGASELSADTAGAGGNDVQSDQSVGSIPSRFDFLFEKYGAIYNVPVKLQKAICMNESELGENPLVKAGKLSSDGLSKGIMQLTEATANDFEDVTLDDLNDPELSVRIACKFLKRIRGSFELVDPRYDEWCVKAYNQGIKGTQDERDGTSTRVAAMANAQVYWERYQRNFKKLG